MSKWIDGDRWRVSVDGWRVGARINARFLPPAKCCP